MSIPVLNIGSFGLGSDADDLCFADQLGEIIRHLGFVSIVGHPVDLALINRAFEVMRQVFVTDMTLEQRLAYEDVRDHQVGYTPPNTEKSVGARVANCMEFWHIQDPRSPHQNIFPDKEVPEFRHVMLELHAKLKHFARRFLRAVAIHLRRDPDFFVKWIENGDNLLRPIHYPPLRGDEDVERSGAHTDINLVTVLVPAMGRGLQVKDPHTGEWIDANNPEDSLICNIGDMLAMHTFGELPSVTHQVVVPKGPTDSRFSIPLFVHPDMGRTLVGAGAFKLRRLRDIKLIGPLGKYEIDH